MEQKIPKIIHYCWFGENPKPQLVLKCIESWKRFCPDYELIEWNESNFDIHSHVFVEEAYREKKWAFVSDFVRASVLLQYGGIYLDTDMELIRPLDPLLQHCLFAGFEANDTIGSAIFGCEAENETIRKYYEYYQSKSFSFLDDDYNTSPIVLTEVLRGNGLRLNGKRQDISGSAIYSKPVFFPTGLGWVFGKYCSRTIGVHHYMDSWGKNNAMGERTRMSKLRLSLLYHARNIVGTSKMYKLGQRMRKLRRGK